VTDSNTETMNRSILVADNNPAILQLLEIGLKDYGYDVLTSSKAMDAINIAKKRKFQFALLDIYLPDMSGIDLGVEIKKYIPGIIIIFITGYPGIKSSIEALRHCAYDYIIKPFKIMQVVSILERASKELNLIGQNQDNLKIIRKLKEENKQLKAMLKKLMPDENRINAKTYDKSGVLRSDKILALRSYEQHLSSDVSEKKNKNNSQ